MTTSKKNLVKVKYSKKTRRLTMTAVATGSAVVKAKIRSKVRGKKKTKVFIYRVKVNAVKPVVTPTEKPAGTPVPTGGAIDAGPGALKKAQKAFALQNEYRKQAGVPELEWSPELYDFCIYRIAASGWDEHKNLSRDKFNYFGNFARKYMLPFAENLYSAGSDSAQGAIEAWYESPGHKYNMLDKRSMTGACVSYKGIWIAVFSDEPESFFQGWQDKPIVKVTIRCYDPATQSIRNDALISCNEKDAVEYAQGMQAKDGEIVQYLFKNQTYVIRATINSEHRGKTIQFNPEYEGQEVVVELPN